ncbi:MAG: arsenate reductase ArsC [Candidatus Levybacteria bacterium]|nr:arsenate reductase ArsC [Candidatus Levybacteria bacterium]
MKKYDVLFICEANVGRSQMAEGYYNAFTGGKNAISASIRDYIEKYNGRSAPHIIAIMHEDGIDISKQRIKVLKREMIDQVKRIIILCNKNICPVYLLSLSKTKSMYIPDLYNISLQEVRKTRDAIKKLVKKLLAERDKIII